MSSTTNSAHLHSVLSRVRGWRPLAKVTALGAAGAVAAGVTLSMLAGGVAPAAGYATTPVLNYTSYAQFSSDIASGAIKYPYKWVMYDLAQ